MISFRSAVCLSTFIAPSLLFSMSVGDGTKQKKIKDLAITEVLVNDFAELDGETPVLAPLPNSVSVDLLKGVLKKKKYANETVNTNDKDALNCRLVNKNWSKLFIFGLYRNELDLSETLSWGGEPKFANSDTRTIYDLVKQGKLWMGEFHVKQGRHSSRGMQQFYDAMIKSKMPVICAGNHKGDVVMLASMMPENHDVKKLCLYSQTSPEDEKALGTLVKKCKNLRTIPMRDRYISDVGAEAVADALKDHEKLEYIDWCGNRITDKGAVALGEALKTNKSLKVLDLYGSQIGWEGAQALSFALQKNKSIQKVFLSGQSFDTWKWNGVDHSQAFEHITNNTKYRIE